MDVYDPSMTETMDEVRRTARVPVRPASSSGINIASGPSAIPGALILINAESQADRAASSTRILFTSPRVQARLVRE